MLEEAFKAGGLDEKYFFGWLRETDRELAKLEKDAAPDGWLCQWDRYGNSINTILTIPYPYFPLIIIRHHTSFKYRFSNKQVRNITFTIH